MVLVGCLTMLWWKRKSWGRPVLFGLGCFIVMLFPVLGFFHISFHEYSLVADHWQYHAIIGVIALALAAGVAVYRRMGDWGRAVVTLASVGVLMVLGAGTWTRACVYAQSETLWLDTIVKNPNVWVAHYNLGNTYLQASRLQDATAEYQQAVRLKPDLAEAHNNLAFTLFQIGDVGGAVEHLEQVVRIKPDSVEGHFNLGNAYLQMGKAQDAIAHWEQALRINPNYTEVHVNLGFALAQRGRFDEAVRHWEIALRLDPNNRDAQRGLERIRNIKSSGAPIVMARLLIL